MTSALDASALSVITSLKNLKLSDFIQCSCYGDYSALTDEKREYNEAEMHKLQSAWLRLLSEYYQAKNDDHASQYVDIVANMERLKFREVHLAFLVESMKVVYSEDIAKTLKEEFPRLKFTVESYLNDLPYIKNFESQSKIQYDTYKKQFEALEAEKSTGGASTPQEKEHSFYQSVITINTILKGSYSVKELSALEYALLLKSVDEYVAANTKQPNNP